MITRRQFLGAAYALGGLAWTGAALVACGGRTPAAPAFSAEALMGHVKVLASDQFEGRAPGTRGEDLTVAYIIEQFAQAGLQPGNPDGTYAQNVPLVGITADPGAALVFRKGAAALKLAFKDDVVAWTKRVRPRVQVDASDVVFVGYGIEAPEFQWDDYKGAALSGKTLVMLINDPPIRSTDDPAGLDATLFGGRAMTYYGRWTYKYEMGAAKNAAAVLIVHETGPAGYPFSVVQGKVTEQFDLAAPDDNMRRPAIEGWITLERARELFALAGQDFDALKARAATRAFAPVDLGVRASMTIDSRIRRIVSRNVVGLLPGSDLALRHEYVVITAHWDHYGIGPEIDGDRIYNGALDNATGVAGMIEMARRFAARRPAPKRSLLFLSVTAEEQGLLGSEYYAENPLYPLNKTLAVINMDSLNIHGRTKDFTVVGLGASDLDDYARDAAAAQGRTVRPDARPEQGGYFRSDHFPFAKRGVPAINAGGGEDFVGRPDGWGQRISAEYIARHYHKPSDEVRPEWDLAGALEDLQVYYAIAERAARTARWPEWKAGSEFKARRDAMLGR
ncbi:MAG TPA: M20/M25/M40 family metallo-hydrolase [Vicinamibacterales bacterium]|nr:M20/M25/M40 family metallo-hydrolase [Vicinamibacterales bacterium]HOQ61621.1 M20/M25/M40 family metallo-hydrolase [Vicinamibacterales bacterium]HPK72406.1 M20/M25/M40 family metallo-hydrolase [Vicinamibacterales bacterium]